MCGSRSSAMNLRIVPIISADKRPSMDVSEVEDNVCRDGQEGEEGGKRGYKCVVVCKSVGNRETETETETGKSRFAWGAGQTRIWRTST